ncbi:haloacid dehalogenase type II [Fictibacillus barbaricus]|uniref:2-haloacid dehalogenase n=1 Tax=Fictibacillus barbaricus TaxID=182136 RepID=A0ABU1TX28_9BACL|nr:haloacid dehalogenase type II [Fictibacillus barbaricus]MDR7071776.1 2-haloacid dehalogenase [Fictibacillus barbaricus]
MTIKAYVFDAYGTLFDVHSVSETAESLFPGKGKEISLQWRKKQVEYFMLHQITGNYKPFSDVTRDALLYTLKNLHEDCKENAVQQLMNSYLELEVYEEVKDTMRQLKENGKKRTIYSNGTPSMLKPLVEKRELHDLLDILSVDDVKQYKPAAAAYQYALEKLEVERHELLFMSSNFWDITGASSFGFRTAWINRSNLEVDELGIQPDYIFEDLRGILNV